MGKVTGFLEIDRQVHKYQPASDRIRHFREFTLPMSDREVEKQAARCMDCGIPYCHGPTGCPVHNQIPDWNDLVYNGDWEEAIRNLHSTNNFPEWTGRICPAPCEEACTLNLEDIPVAIKTVEQAIADKAYEAGFVRPYPADHTTGKKVAIIGSGPAGMAAAQQLGRAGHQVHVYERESRPGGLMRYGIPDFKIEKHYIDRRIEQMQGEGVTFHCGVNVGVDKPVEELLAEHDAVLYCGGSERPRPAGIPGGEFHGVHDAMPYLVQQNRRVGGEDIQSVAWAAEPILAGGKHVVVVGGGDTASDCVGTAFRQGAVRVTQLDIRPRPPEKEDKLAVWPYWATKMRTSSSQAEGADREFQVATLEFVGEDGVLTGVKCCQVDEKRKPVPGTEFVIRADLAFIAIGFSGPLETGVLSEFGDRLKTDIDRRNSVNVNADDREYRTTIDRLFAAGDARRGQSLVVWAIREGRQAAHAIDTFLMGSSVLPR
ncbi:glutamate synthase subunit beta [Nitratireductor aquimarinus]|uniref:glutamate synthase subunit beta n=1 Tax=Nitratireductor TaxID=245876 RepID=UPI0019D3E03F|nr:MULTISPECIES: glutamate synthase subunit beta [Nitratireductor]MBN7761979.1 glutamate synthase subunit beta [Nitratireductor aquibiodomus]MBN8243981.1 glutamate synthase subunit beta [Nitratireductor aquimarinus]MBY6131515.1 glutamate synthase subunit beta [Nitratireductor aquimarinus]MCA1301051.1 glutamate synthase subunit beta [Nitratireductor aquimarinus]MCV0351859.1 glutamate synthase subunit beta [Nitratireductor sp.]